MRLTLFVSLLCLSLLTKGFLSACGADCQCACQAEALHQRLLDVAKFYELPPGVDFVEITESVLNSSHVEEDQRQLIQIQGRRFFVFHYPSDGLKVKGLLSIAQNPVNQPVIVLLRDGHGLVGLLDPGSVLLHPGEATVVVTTYRGGISEGRDEFGGADVNDVKNLIVFLPMLAQQLSIQAGNPTLHLVGIGRGAMQMFLTLARYPRLQARISKIVSYQGLLDLQETINSKPELKQLFINDCGLEEGINDQEWIHQRDPLLSTELISKTLPILMVQSTAEGQGQMLDKLLAEGHQVTYFEIGGEDGSLLKADHVIPSILDWLRQ